jgi:hypothetical protein
MFPYVNGLTTGVVINVLLEHHPSIGDVGVSPRDIFQKRYVLKILKNLGLHPRLVHPSSG